MHAMHMLMTASLVIHSVHPSEHDCLQRACLHACVGSLVLRQLSARSCINTCLPAIRSLASQVDSMRHCTAEALVPDRPWDPEPPLPPPPLANASRQATGHVDTPNGRPAGMQALAVCPRWHRKGPGPARGSDAMHM